MNTVKNCALSKSTLKRLRKNHLIDQASPLEGMLFHNRVAHSTTTLSGLNGFRAYLVPPTFGDLVLCSCGWQDELGEHYRIRGKGSGQVLANDPVADNFVHLTRTWIITKINADGHPAEMVQYQSDGYDVVIDFDRGADAALMKKHVGSQITLRPSAKSEVTERERKEIEALIARFADKGGKSR
jgi:hypothetical protein